MIRQIVLGSRRSYHPIHAFGLLFRRATSKEWESGNPILLRDELAGTTDTGVLKIGDGKTPWNDLEPQTPVTLYDAISRSLRRTP